MSYYYNKVLTETSFDEAIEKVTGELSKEGFGVLTEIDVKETLKEKLDVDFKKYRILGACNPSFAHKALQAEDKIGVMLPCNVIVEEREPGVIEVSAQPGKEIFKNAPCATKKNDNDTDRLTLTFNRLTLWTEKQKE